MTEGSTPRIHSRIHWPVLLIAIFLMVVGSVASVFLVDTQGQVNHGQVALCLWSMSVGFIRGVGFIPHAWLWRWLFSAWACVGALAAVVLWRLLGGDFPFW